jgi:hypothetical protein
MLASVCYGAKEVSPSEAPKKETYPLGLLKKEQIAEKFLAGRTLDPIEGLWEYEPGESVMIVKVEALPSEKEKYAGYDYLVLDARGQENNALIIHKLKRISPFIYQVNQSTFFKILSPISIVKQEHLSIGWYDYFYIRTYPQVELKVQ